jgi:hypothetical protein
MIEGMKNAAQEIKVGELTVEVTRKKVKNLNLRVLPPDGRVTISAPHWMGTAMIQAFARAKLEWIRAQQEKMRQQAVKSAGEKLEEGGDVWLWGRRYRLKVIENCRSSAVEVRNSEVVLRVRAGADAEKKRDMLERWYRGQVQEAAAPLAAKWEEAMGVKVKRLAVRRMRTRWGSCTPKTGSIRLNSELAKRAPEYLEYVVVHELAHLLVRSHGKQFARLMDRHLPNWRKAKKELRRHALK